MLQSLQTQVLQTPLTRSACLLCHSGRQTLAEGTVLLASCQGSRAVQALDTVLSRGIWPLLILYLPCRRSGAGCRC